MKFGKKVINALVLLVFVAGIGLSCTKVYHKPPPTTKKQKRHGPPPHAPAHGYRAKTGEGLAIVYDSKLRVYVVVDVLNHYYHNGFYYRFNGGRWEVSAKFHGSWQVAAEYKVPTGLRSGTKNKGKKKKKSKN
jgi:hypothetical protein